MNAVIATPTNPETAPTPMAVIMVARKLLVNCWVVATGMIIKALTSSSPTVRMARLTLTAAKTEIIEL